MDDKKRDAAEVGTICDTNEDMNLTKNIIAQAIRQGKDAVYLKRDGWTMMPQLPTEEGEYLQIRRGEYGFHYWPVRWWKNGCLKEVEWTDSPEYAIKIIAWRRLPDMPEWIEEEAAE